MPPETRHRPRRSTRHAAAILIPVAAALVAADDPRPVSRAAIEADYREAVARADRDRIARLTQLAASQSGAEAEATYLEIFRFSVGADRFSEAEAAADRVIASGARNREVSFLAYLVKILAEADAGKYDEAVRDLGAFVQSPIVRSERAPQFQTGTVLAIGEAFVRRLLQRGRYENARQVSELIVRESRTPAVREHFENYLKRLELVGKPAPAIEGRDADGEQAGLGALKGKVVLVVFWATWCPPCVENLPLLQAIAERFERDGLAILGVNLDEGPERERAIRKFIVDFAIPWPSVLNGEGAQDFAGAYSIKEIPATVLIGRDGKVLTFDLSAEGLAEAIQRALGPAQERR